MKKRLTRTLAAVCAGTLLLSAVGCGSKATNTGTDTPKPAETKTETKKEEPATPAAAQKDIEFWTVFTGPDGVNMTKMVDEYNKTNPKIKVTHRPIDGGDMYQKIPTVVQSGKQVPDLAVVHAERLALFAESDMLMPMNDYFAANGKISADNYVKSAWDMGEVGGKHYSVPLDVHSFVTYYNKDLLDKYGPTVLDDGVITFEEIQQVGDAAKKDEIKSMGITWMRVKFLAWYSQLGGELSTDGENPDFNNDKAAKVLDTVKALHDNGYTNIDGEDPVQMFRSGKLVFCPEGIWMKNSLEEIPNLNFGMAHSISFDPAKQVNWTSSHQMVMFKNKEMTDERAAGIMDFLAWVGENSVEWARAGQVPASLKILQNDEFKGMKQAFLLDNQDSLKIFDYKYFGFAAEALDKIVWEVPFGRMETKEGLDQAQKEVRDRIANQ